MATINDVKVTKISETNNIGASGKPEQQIAVTWVLGTHGPFTETFPKATFDQGSALMKIKELASKLVLFPM
jgi:hypothetical protein